MRRGQISVTRHIFNDMSMCPLPSICLQQGHRGALGSTDPLDQLGSRLHCHTCQDCIYHAL